MTGAFFAIWTIALLIVLAIVGIPRWMTLRHRPAPGYREARAHHRARQAVASGKPAGDVVPTEPVAAVDGLTIVRKTRGTEDGDMVVPAQRHW